MGELRCVDGSVLSVAAVACRDRVGHTYEITLELERDTAPFAAVGERCGYRLAELADRVRAARSDPEQAALWPDPDDRFPGPVRRQDYRPGEAEYFSLRSRDRGDPAGTGELRCTLRASADWIGECAGVGVAHGGPRRTWPGVRAVLGQHELPGRPAAPAEAGEPGRFRRDPPGGCWRLTRRAVLEAWGPAGIGVRAVLTSAELVTFLDTVLVEPEGPDGPTLAGTTSVGGRAASESTSSRRQGGASSALWRQRGRTPDGSARSRLPALRAKARGVAVPECDTPARRSDVRR